MIAFLDTETTGLRVEHGHRIIEIGIITENGAGEWCGLRWRINPLEPDGTQHEIEEGAQAVHGITWMDLIGQPAFAEIADQVLEVVRDRTVVIHNAQFDLEFLDAELARINREPFLAHCARVICSRERSKRIWPDQSASLDALCDRLGVDRSRRTHHGALVDADLLAQCWARMPEVAEV